MIEIYTVICHAFTAVSEQAEIVGGGARRGGDHPEGILEEEVDTAGASAHQGSGW